MPTSPNPFQLNDVVRVVSPKSRFHGCEGRVSENDRSQSVPYVVKIEGEIMGICFTAESLELVESAAALPSLETPSLDFFEVYSAEGEFRWATTNRDELGRRRMNDYVLTRSWIPQGSPETYLRVIG